MLAYHSIKAQLACKSANDHHVNIFEASMDELIVPYIRSCISDNKLPSPNGYYTWMQQVVFTYLLSMSLCTAAVQRNNSEVMLICRKKTAPLFYGVNITCYQEIEYRDLTIRTLAPEGFIQYLKDNVSFSVSGQLSKGGDFVIKKIRLKMVIPTGLPTTERWLRACRSLDTLDKVSMASKLNSNISLIYMIFFNEDVDGLFNRLILLFQKHPLMAPCCQIHRVTEEACLLCARLGLGDCIDSLILPYTRAAIKASYGYGRV